MQKIHKILFFSFILSILNLGFLNAQTSREYLFEHISMKDGLSMNPVMSIIQDKKGFMWFGTQDGLNRFDGYSIKIFKSIENDATSLSDNFITSIVDDNEGNLWIGTLGGGLNKYNYQSNKFERVKISNEIINLKIWSICADKQNQLWIGTDRGLYIFNTKSKSLIPLDNYKGLNISNNTSILSIYLDSKNMVWIGTTLGLFCYDKNLSETNFFQHQAFNNSTISNNGVLTIFESRKKEIWIGTLDGLCKYNPNAKIFNTIKFSKEKQNSKTEDKDQQFSENIYSIVNNYGGNTIRCINEDDNGVFWIGTDMELVAFDPITNTFKNYKKDLINPDGINDHFIRSMFIDKSNCLWVGTLGNGINKANLNPKGFRHYLRKLNEENCLSENYVRAFAEDTDGKLWVGTLVGGLNNFDPKTKIFTHYKSNGKLDGSTPSDNNIWSLCIEKDKLWAGTNNGLNVLDFETKKWKYFFHLPNNKSSLSENTVRNIFKDSKGILWIGTEGGLNMMKPDGKSFDVYTKGFTTKTVSDNTVWKITEDKNHLLWLATNNGLNKFDYGAKQFTHYFNKLNDTSSLSSNNVRTVFVDKNNVLWVGTQNGLNKYLGGNKFKRYHEKNGLPNAFIYSILQDENDILWISTNKGICSFNTITEVFKSYDLYDGLQDLEFNTNSSLYSKSHIMYFGGPNGFNEFNPLQLTTKVFMPNVEITSLSIVGKNYEGLKNIITVDSLIFDCSKNILYFEFASFDFNHPSRNQYLYKMEGFNESWIKAKNVHFITYTNLDPGDYVFKVRGTNVDGIWSDKIDELKITITPPYWKTKWFYTLVSLSIGIIIYFLYRDRVRNLNEKNILLEIKVKERTLELENEKKRIEAINLELDKLSIVARETENAVVIMESDGTIEWINEGYKKIHLGDDDYTKYYGKNLRDFSSNSDIDNILLEVLKSKVTQVYESHYTNPDGKTIYTHTTLTPIIDESQNVTKLILIDTDVSERKLKEDIIKGINKDITDSINYAVRIQKALMPDENYIKTILPDAFVLFKPRDIVSGDFYFVETIKTNDGKFLHGFAVGDCTGHGIPGSFMSIIGITFLNLSMKEKEVNSPSEALEYVSKKITETFRIRSDSGIIKDGMDIAFCVYDPNSLMLYFSGANNSVVIVRGEELTELKGIKRALGYSYNEKPFVTDSFQLQKGDCLYLYSDGYADQFGGPNGKKLMYRPLKELLIKNSSQPMDIQKQQLKEYFSNWKGNLKQIDDVCVMGIRI